MSKISVVGEPSVGKAQEAFNQLPESTTAEGSIKESISIESSENSFLQVETSGKLGDDKSTSSSLYSTDSMSSTSTQVPSLPVEQTKQSVDQDSSPDSGESPTLSINSLVDDDETSSETKSAKGSISSSAPLVSTSNSVKLDEVSSPVPSPSISLESTQVEDLPIPTSFPADDLDGTKVEFNTMEKEAVKQNFRLGNAQSVYEIVPTQSLQAIEMTTATYDKINPNRIGLIDETTDDIDHFLGIGPPVIN